MWPSFGVSRYYERKSAKRYFKGTCNPTVITSTVQKGDLEMKSKLCCRRFQHTHTCTCTVVPKLGAMARGPGGYCRGAMGAY